jgi:hypothetical protein
VLGTKVRSNFLQVNIFHNQLICLFKHITFEIGREREGRERKREREREIYRISMSKEEHTLQTSTCSRSEQKKANKQHRQGNIRRGERRAEEGVHDGQIAGKSRAKHKRRCVNLLNQSSNTAQCAVFLFVGHLFARGELAQHRNLVYRERERERERDGSKQIDERQKFITKTSAREKKKSDILKERCRGRESVCTVYECTSVYVRERESTCVCVYE